MAISPVHWSLHLTLSHRVLSSFPPEAAPPLCGQDTPSFSPPLPLPPSLLPSLLLSLSPLLAPLPPLDPKDWPLSPFLAQGLFFWETSSTHIAPPASHSPPCLQPALPPAQPAPLSSNPDLLVGSAVPALNMFQLSWTFP